MSSPLVDSSQRSAQHVTARPGRPIRRQGRLHRPLRARGGLGSGNDETLNAMNPPTQAPRLRREIRGGQGRLLLRAREEARPATTRAHQLAELGEPTAPETPSLPEPGPPRLPGRFRPHGAGLACVWRGLGRIDSGGPSCSSGSPSVIRSLTFSSSVPACEDGDGWAPDSPDVRRCCSRPSVFPIARAVPAIDWPSRSRRRY
jgi:hypothetical protein